MIKKMLRQAWTDVKPYFWAAAVIFFAGLFAGAMSNGDIAWLDKQLQSISDIAKKANASDNVSLSMFWLILVNNLVATAFAMYLGIAACIMPLFTLGVNGLVMGYLFGQMANEGANLWSVIVRGILPHGILELPAIFLACAYGILLGVRLMQGIGRSLTGKTKPWARFAEAMKGSVAIYAVVALLLLVAAVIESTLTLYLVKS
ncbi:stage II sporulation protein M [Cohnella sp. GCM10020058]|uniref:stage II sporulation protein M n=1 Tax=Cohnella sp. GCM10020058 TaxID=3317330 RepID=UPI003633D5ED